jgi:hypothetical protein
MITAPVARPLLQHTALTARFKAGLTPMQHHWELYDSDETPIGRTRIVYGDGLAGKAMRRSLTLVGMASGTLQRAEVLDVDGQVVAHLTAHNGRKDFLTEVADADGRPVGHAQRRLHEGFRLQTTDGRELAALDYTPEQDDPVALRDPDGQPLAAMTRVPAKPVGLVSLTDELVWGVPDRSERLPRVRRDLRVVPGVAGRRAAADAARPRPGDRRNLLLAARPAPANGGLRVLRRPCGRLGLRSPASDRPLRLDGLGSCRRRASRRSDRRR